MEKSENVKNWRFQEVYHKFHWKSNWKKNWYKFFLEKSIKKILYLIKIPHYRVLKTMYPAMPRIPCTYAFFVQSINFAKIWTKALRYVPYTIHIDRYMDFYWVVRSKWFLFIIIVTSLECYTCSTLDHNVCRLAQKKEPCVAHHSECLTLTYKEWHNGKERTRFNKKCVTSVGQQACKENCNKVSNAIQGSCKVSYIRQSTLYA